MLICNILENHKKSASYRTILKKFSIQVNNNQMI